MTVKDPKRGESTYFGRGEGKSIKREGGRRLGENCHDIRIKEGHKFKMNWS